MGDTAKVNLPSCEMILSPRDDAAEFDDTVDQQQNFNDDPSVVVFRKANKIGFFIKVLPMRSSGEVKVSFRMKYDYRNLTTALSQTDKKDEVMWLTQYVY